MADYIFPTTGYNARAVTPREYEDLNNPMAPDGLIGTPALPALIYADNTLRGYKIRANQSALIRGHRWESGTVEVPVTVAANTTAATTRIDLVVLRMTRNPTTAHVVTIQGTPLASPVAPSPTMGTDTATGMWDLPLATVTVPYNAATTLATQCVPLAWYVGEDGQILCTPTTRPPHHPGRFIYDTATGLRYLSDGAAWVLLETPQTVVLANDQQVSGLAFVDSLLSFPAKNGGTYRFDVTVFHKASAINGDIRISFAHSGGLTHFGGYMADVAATASIAQAEFRGRQYETASPVTPLAGGSLIDGNGAYARLSGLFICSADGPFRLTWGQNVNSGNTLLLEGSYMTWARIS